MKIIVRLMTICAILFTFCHVFAQDYVSTTMGRSVPMWIENSAAVNNHGDVVWTHYDYNTPSATASARLFYDGNHLTLDAGTGQDNAPFSQSYATSIDDDGTAVGWAAINATLAIREAKLWKAGSQQRIDLHAYAPTGYRVSVADRIQKMGSGDTVVGWVRKKTSASDLPEAYAWQINGSTVTGIRLQTPSGATSAFARGIGAPDKNGDIWACGSSASASSYAQVVCWNLANVANGQVSPTMTINNAYAGAASSSIEQVRTITLGGEQQSIAVGYTITTQGNAQPLAYNLTTGEVYENLSLLADGSGVLKDVVREEWSHANATEGLLFVGAMATTSAFNVESNGPLDSMSTMRATYQSRLGTTPSDGFRVCRMDDNLNAGTMHQITSAVSPNGLYRLVWNSSNQDVTRLERKQRADTNLNVYVRDLQVRTQRAQRKAYSNAAGTTPTTVQYYWAETPGSTTNGSIAWSPSAGCEPFDLHKANGCDPHRTFDLGGDTITTIDFNDVISGQSRTLITQGAHPDDTFVQVALQGSGNQCFVSNVMRANDSAHRNNFATQSNETGRNYAQCDLSAPPEYDTDLNSSLDHCGACNAECVTIHNDSTCNMGTCEIIQCDSGWVDLNGSAIDGCECHHTGSDSPELTAPFLDTNCDGIDGTIANSIFVDTNSGNDAGACGTMATPCKTIQRGIDVATAGKDVLISQGNYTEGINLKNGVSLYGGYNAADNWSRSAGHVVTVTGTTDGGHGYGARGTTITSATTLNQLTIKAPNATGNSTSSVAIACQNCNGLTVAYVTAQAGTGTAGTNGAAGASGANGNAGGQGAKGCPDSTSCGNPGGTGGSSSCGAPGGNGGRGGQNRNPGIAGSAGTTASGGATRGTGGSGGPNPDKCDHGTHTDGKVGNPGSAGNVGANGAGGSGGQLLGTGYWRSSDGSIGATGQTGGGGGGGGGGSGQGGAGVFGPYCLSGSGAAGGGGGGGACGGKSGAGGTGGGASIAIVLSNSANALVRNTVLVTTNAGKGGNGGNGGSGGTGGNGGPTQPENLGSGVWPFNGQEVGAGLNGGKGGNGGRGGHGGGGAGGISSGIVVVGASTVNQSNNTFTIGTAGAGGTSSGNAGTAGCGNNVCYVP